MLLTAALYKSGPSWSAIPTVEFQGPEMVDEVVEMMTSGCKERVIPVAASTMRIVVFTVDDENVAI